MLLGRAIPAKQNLFIENEHEFLNNLDRDIKIAEESLKEMNDRYSKLR